MYIQNRHMLYIHIFSWLFWPWPKEAAEKYMDFFLCDVCCQFQDEHCHRIKWLLTHHPDICGHEIIWKAGLSNTGSLLDPLQFSYQANKSVDDSVNIGMHYILCDLVETLVMQSERWWCSQNHLEQNPLKTVEMKVDLRSDQPTLHPLTLFKGDWWCFSTFLS